MALLFNGTTQYVNTGYAPTFTTVQPFSVGGWIYRTAAADGAVLFGAQALTPATSYILIQASNTSPYNDIQFRIRDVNNLATICQSAAGSIALNTWYYVMGVRDVAADKIRLYIDGVEIGAGTTDASTGDIDLSAASCFLAAKRNISGNPAAYHTGNLDDWASWNVALTAAEVLMLAQSRRRLAPTIQGANLVRWWPLQGEHGAAATGANSVSERMTGTGATPVNSPLYQGSVLAWRQQMQGWEVAHAIFLRPDAIDVTAAVLSPGVAGGLNPAVVDVVVAIETPGVGLTYSADPIDIAAAVEAGTPIILAGLSAIDVQVLAEAVGVRMDVHPDAINVDAQTHWPTTIPAFRAIIVTVRGARS